MTGETMMKWHWKESSRWVTDFVGQETYNRMIHVLSQHGQILLAEGYILVGVGRKVRDETSYRASMLITPDLYLRIRTVGGGAAMTWRWMGF